jgi:hypothetical protein
MIQGCVRQSEKQQICLLLSALIGIGCPEAAGFVRENIGELMQWMEGSSILVREAGTELVLRAGAAGIVADGVVLEVLRFLPFQRRVKRMSVVCEWLLAMVRERPAVRLGIAVVFGRVFSTLASRIEARRMTNELIQFVEDFYVGVATEFGIEEIQRQLPDNWEQEPGIALRIADIIARAQARLQQV